MKYSTKILCFQNTTFFQQSIIIEGNEKVLPVGNSKYKFEFDLPEDGKGSFSSDFASVKYMMTCTADVPWGVDAEATNELFVTKIRDLNEDIESLEEADGQEEKKVGWGCLAQGPIGMKANIQHQLHMIISICQSEARKRLFAFIIRRPECKTSEDRFCKR